MQYVLLFETFLLHHPRYEGFVQLVELKLLEYFGVFQPRKSCIWHPILEFYLNMGIGYFPLFLFDSFLRKGNLGFGFIRKYTMEVHNGLHGFKMGTFNVLGNFFRMEILGRRLRASIVSTLTRFREAPFPKNCHCKWLAIGRLYIERVRKMMRRGT